MSRKTTDDPKTPPHPDDWGPRNFEAAGHLAYTMEVPQASTTIRVTRLRRERNELIGELSVKCGLAGARTVRGILSAGDFNLSSIQARGTRAKHLQGRACAPDIDWEGLIEEFCQLVIESERAGQPAVLLHDVPLTTDDSREHDLLGMTVPTRDPAILFGDGGSAKSYLALWIAGQLAQRGEIVLYCDWESHASDHRSRLESLYAPALPILLYVRCDAPLVSEVDRIRRLVAEHGVTYLVCDSIAYGCPGKPEDAESALGYFRALRSLGPLGALLIAHVSKADDGDKRPFGSSFWHNSARATWNIKRSNPDSESPVVHVMATHRKANNGRFRPAIGFALDFGYHKVTVSRSNPALIDEFAKGLPARHRIMELVARKPSTVAELADELGVTESAIRKEVDRNEKLYIKLPSAGGASLYRIGLAVRE